MEQVKAKQVEMWKWFKLPVDCSLVINADKTNTEYPDSISIDGNCVLTGHHVEKVEIAINSYDKHVELIAKQAEQIKMLREALELVRPEVYYNQDGVEVWAGWSMTIGTDDDVDSKTMQKIHEALSAMEQE
jgi:hypothetical protein